MAHMDYTRVSASSGDAKLQPDALVPSAFKSETSSLMPTRVRTPVLSRAR